METTMVALGRMACTALPRLLCLNRLFVEAVGE